MIKLISRALAGWQAWRNERKLARVMPEVVARKQKIAALRISHKSTKTVIQAQRQDIHAALGLEVR